MDKKDQSREIVNVAESICTKPEDDGLFERLLREAITLDPEGPAVSSLCGFLVKRECWAEAEPLARKTVAIEEQAWLERVGSLGREKWVSAAERLANAMSWLAYILFNQEKLEEAECLCREVFELTPPDSHMHFNLGRVLQVQDKNAEALGCFDQVLKMNSCHAPARFRRAELLVQSGYFQEALGEAQRAQEDSDMQLDRKTQALAAALIVDLEARLAPEPYPAGPE